MTIAETTDPAAFVLSASEAFMATTASWADLIEQDPHRITIEMFQSERPGDGKLVLDHLSGLCDQHGVTLDLRILVHDEENPEHDAQKLVRYYEQFGFKETGRGQNERDGADEIYMERKPR